MHNAENNKGAIFSPVSLLHILQFALTHYAEKSAYDFMGKKATYREMGEMIDLAAAGLQKRGVKAGTKVGLYMPNTPYYPVMFFAALKAGATVVNYDPTSTEEEIRKLAGSSGTDILVTLNLRQFCNHAKSQIGGGHVAQVISCDIGDMLPLAKRVAWRVMKRKDIVAPVSGDGLTDFRDLVDNDGKMTPVSIDPSVAAVLQFTGGTTGGSKGVMLSHFNMAANFMQIVAHLGDAAEGPKSGLAIRHGQERFLASVPYSHIFGLTFSMVTAIGMGAEQIIIADPRDTAALTKTIKDKAVTVLPAVPYRLRRIAEQIGQQPRRYAQGLPDLRLVLSGGSALSAQVKEDFERAARRKDVVLQAYGMTEASPALTCLPLDGEKKAGSVGVPLLGTEIKICDLEAPHAALPPMQAGEVYARGPQIMKSYFNDPQATAAALADGWLRTGDIGYKDEDGYLFLLERTKDVINIMGKNVFPLDIEKEILCHEAVAECAVIGVADEKTDEAAKAFVRFKPDAKAPDENELRLFLAERLSKIKLPRYFEFRSEELPKTPFGKPDKKALRASAAEQLQHSLPENGKSKKGIAR